MRKKDGKVSLKSWEWVMAKKEQRRRQGKGHKIFMHIILLHTWYLHYKILKICTICINNFVCIKFCTLLKQSNQKF